MARVALIKIFTGLNLGVAQLAAELLRAGHESLIIYFKDYIAAPASEAHRFQTVPYSVTISLKRGQDWSFTFHKPVTEREYELLLDVLRRFQPDLVGFSLTSSAMDLAADVTSRIRRELAVPIIWGGCGPTLEREKTLAHADLLCTNEGEEVITEIAERLDRGARLTDVHGTWSRNGGDIIQNAERALLCLDHIAAPDFDPSRAVRIENDAVEANVEPPALFPYVIMTSRGCPFSCSFCIESIYQEMFGKKGSLRRRAVSLVIDELVEAQKRYGFRSIQFFDDVFTTHRAWLREFAPKYAAAVGLPFWCYTYPTTTRREDILLLRDAGCASMTMGVQSGSERMLKEHFNRPTALRTVVEAAKIVTDAGIDLFVDLITKVDFEIEEDLKANVELLLQLPTGARVTGFGHMVKFPNYLYSQEIEKQAIRPMLGDELYAYYHRLYYVALSSLPHATKRAIIADPLYRRHPELLDRLMGTGALTLLLVDPAKKAAREQRAVVDMSTAQATVPSEYLNEALGMGTG